MTDPSKVITIRYRNHRGEVALRRIVPQGIWFGATLFHLDPQYLLLAFDVDKQMPRDFACRDILEWGAKEEST